MPEITVQFTNLPSEMKAFRYNELEAKISVESGDKEAYWVEAMITVPPPLSLAPAESLEKAKTTLGILTQGKRKEKRFKIFAQNNVYPYIYKVTATLFIYDEEGVVVDRRDYYDEIQCNDLDAKIL